MLPMPWDTKISAAPEIKDIYTYMNPSSPLPPGHLRGEFRGMDFYLD